MMCASFGAAPEVRTDRCSEVQKLHAKAAPKSFFDRISSVITPHLEPFHAVVAAEPCRDSRNQSACEKHEVTASWMA
jgi:hypothetical protein